MDSISFLNKKYTSIHNTIPLANSRSRSSRTFMPTISANLSHTHTHTHTNNNVVNDNHINQIAQTNVQPGVNHCL
jgi:adenine specific DNA methylase Mod